MISMGSAGARWRVGLAVLAVGGMQARGQRGYVDCDPHRAVTCIMAGCASSNLNYQAFTSMHACMHWSRNMQTIYSLCKIP